MNLKAVLFLVYLLLTTSAFASGGYDNGTPAGEGKIDLELTLNPGDMIDKGQSYLVWGYGLTPKLDFHGYVSHEAGGTDQIYYGLMYNFLSNDFVDLSTAFGARHRKNSVDFFLPQLLYTLKLPQQFDIIGSVVNVYSKTQNYNRGLAFDVAFRIPISEQFRPDFISDLKLAIGAFRGVSGNTYPTYSIDMRF